MKGAYSNKKLHWSSFKNIDESHLKVLINNGVRSKVIIIHVVTFLFRIFPSREKVTFRFFFGSVTGIGLQRLLIFLCSPNIVLISILYDRIHDLELIVICLFLLKNIGAFTNNSNILTFGN